MDPRINHKQIEEKWQALRYGKFKSIPNEKKSFTIMTPPPNVTGQLHVGHMLNSTFNDIIARRKRQEGFNVCFVPGLDHAGLATQTKVEKFLKEKGIDKSTLTNEQFFEECTKWKNEYGGKIINQFKRLGLSCDWDRLTFTLDEKYTEKVTDTFVKLYQAGLIYKGNYMTNWCTILQTAISDEECVTTEEEKDLHYINYKLVSNYDDNNADATATADTADVYLTVATTRPETLFGDVAIAYNPNDERYKKYKGSYVVIPLLNKRIPIIEDERIKIEFGTGLCKITPAHDKDDFVTGQNNNLPTLTIIDKCGHICNTGTKYDGLYKDKARKEIIKELKELRLLTEIIKKKSNIVRCSRSGSIIEPMITEQWFIKMKPLAEIASELLKSEKVKFIPERISNTFNSWIANIRDWCISRQIIYSHKIPIWYCSLLGHENCANTKPNICSKCDDTNLIQDNNTLDTWASSYIYQFATFSDDELDYYYPVDLMITGQDILFFWIMRMMMTSGFLHNKQPFNKVLFHGIVRDENNKKMSKSLQNCIDPLEIIDKIGLDPIRFSLMMTVPKDGDLKISIQSFDVGKMFCTKLWNVTRFLQMNKVFDQNTNTDTKIEYSDEDVKFIQQFKSLNNEIIESYDKLDFQNLVRSLHNFTWNVFANDYLEYAKDKLTNDRKNILSNVFSKLIILLYPIIPHVTEEIWEIMGNSNLYLIELQNIQ